MNGKKLRESEMLFARELAAQAWCKEETKHTDMDVNLAEAFAEILVKEMYAPILVAPQQGNSLMRLRQGLI